MKKAFATFFSVLILTSFCVGCSSQSNDNTPSKIYSTTQIEHSKKETQPENSSSENEQTTDTMPAENINEQSKETYENGDDDNTMNENSFYIKANGTTFTAEFSDNSSAESLKELLSGGDISVSLHDYGNFEKVGLLGADLPRNDSQITTEAGDIILYQGNQITIYYDTNSWSFTRLGKIENTTREQLLDAFGDGDVTVTISLSS